MSTTERVTLGQLPEEEKKKHLAALAAVLTDDDKDINLDDIEVVDESIHIHAQAMVDLESHEARTPFKMPAPTKQIGPNGVIQIYPAKQGGPAYFLGDDFEKDKIQITYGGTIVKYTTKKVGNFTVYNTAGWPITYNSGSPPGRSVRVNTYPIGGIKANKTKFSWKDNPGYLYKPEGPRNTEMTVYVMVHGSLGTHQSCAGKKGGREEDEIRSLSELVWPTDTHSTAQFNWNYAHFPYVNGKMTIVKPAPKLVPEKWFGIKYIHVAATDKNTAAHWELWGDENPFGPNNEILNNWELYGTYEDSGCKEYNNIPMGWKYMRDVFRVDGFKNLDFCLLSDVEIDLSGSGGVIIPPVDKEPIAEEAIVIQYMKAHPEKLAEFVSSLGIGITPPPTDIPGQYIAAIKGILKMLPKDVVAKILASLNADFK